MSLSGIKGFASGGGSAGPPGPGNLVGAVNTDSIAMTVANPGVSNILSATLLIGMTTAPANSFGVSLNVYSGTSPGLVGFFAVGGITELTSSVLQFAGIGQAVGGTFGIRVNQSSGTTSGFLSFTDWNTFNNKQDTLKIGPLSASSFTNGATLFGPTFQLGPADGTNPGVITTGGQTFAGDKTFLGVIAAQSGTLAAPGFHLGTDVGTGFFRAAANQLNLAVLGVTVMVWGSNNIQSGVPILGAPGSTGAPAFSFNADSDTGTYNPAANTFGVVVGSTEALRMTSAGSSFVGFLNAPAHQISGTSSGFISLVAGTSLAGWTLLMPQVQGGASSIFMNNGSGGITWAVLGAGGFGATTSLLLTGASSGVFTQTVGTSFASFTNTWPIAQGGTYTFLRNDGQGGLTWDSSNYVARYSTSAGQVITSQVIIDFGTSTFDPLSAVTTGASWKFTCPAGGNGYYQVNVGLECTSTTFTVTRTIDVFLYKNDVLYSQIGEFNFTTGTLFPWVLGSDIVNLVAGDKINIQAVSNLSGGITFDSNTAHNFVSIGKLGL